MKYLVLIIAIGIAYYFSSSWINKNPEIISEISDVVEQTSSSIQQDYASGKKGIIELMKNKQQIDIQESYPNDWSAGILARVAVNPYNIYGSPWDGLSGYLAGLHLNGSSPPDIVACIIALDSIATQKQICVYNKESLYMGEKTSPCHDGFDCDFLIKVPANSPWALILYDLDSSGQHDFIDGLIITTGKTSQEISGNVTADIQNIIKEFAPPPIHRPGEKIRRLRSLPQVNIDKCSEGCQLQQSIISLVTMDN